ncbi:MAG: TenA family transcriptional regulator [Gemmatimonadota bacterium]
MKEFTESRLALGSGELWDLGTYAEFLDAIGDGSLPEDAFHRWLVQDYLFVKGLAAFASLTVAKTPRPAQSLLIAGLSALDDELDWFEAYAEAKSLDLGAEFHPACQRYVDFLIAAGFSQPFQVLLAILYGVEVAYTVAWGRLEAQGPYAEFISRWTHEDFQTYVRALLRIADEHLHPGQQEMFDQVMRHERDFWQMTWEG